METTTARSSPPTETACPHSGRVPEAHCHQLAPERRTAWTAHSPPHAGRLRARAAPPFSASPCRAKTLRAHKQDTNQPALDTTSSDARHEKAFAANGEGLLNALRRPSRLPYANDCCKHSRPTQAETTPTGNSVRDVPSSVQRAGTQRMMRLQKKERGARSPSLRCLNTD